MIKEGYVNYTDLNVRLIILKALAGEDNATMNDWRLEKELERFGYTKSREYLRNQLKWLEKEAGAVRLSEAGSAVMATLTKVGRGHVDRRNLLEGIQEPSDIE